jgi:predicted ATPase
MEVNDCLGTCVSPRQDDWRITALWKPNLRNSRSNLLDIRHVPAIICSRQQERDPSDENMISSLEIKNFRCFKELYLDNLKQFNIIVGDSGSGKTALLEAIFLLAAGSPEVWMRLRQWRGAGNLIRLTGTRNSYESLFRDIFFDFDKRKGANFRLTGPDGTARSLTIQYPHEERYGLKAGRDSEPEEENAYLVDPIVFTWKVKGKDFKSKVDLKDGLVQFKGFNRVYPVWFSSPVINDTATIAPLFSELSLRKKAGSFVQAVSKLFPFVQDVSLESIAGEPTLCVSLDSVSEKVPIGSISSGLNKYISIMVAAAATSGGVLLIDEFEVGFYYKTLPKILSSIFSYCKEHSVQVVATTHSYEFLQALLSVMKSPEDTSTEFAILRSERLKNQSSIKLLEDPLSAIESGFEVR